MNLLYTIASLILAIGATCACPGSPSSVHAKCQMTVTFDQQCAKVKEEISARIQSDSWIDPHNQGLYTLGENSDDKLAAKRLSGNKKYTDLFDFNFMNLDDSSGCTVQACSESQVLSILDFDTNYCNLRNLYCNRGSDGCEVIHHELTYAEQYQDCWQRNKKSCISDANSS